MSELNLNSGIPTLVDFYAPWCVPCQWLEPILEQVRLEFKANLNILKINIDEHEVLAERFDIKSVPTLILFLNDEVKWRMAGFLLAPDLIKIIKPHLLVA